MHEIEQHIPLFPLNIFLLPGEQLPLHIFEPRYRQLFQEAEEEGVRFGLPFEQQEKGVHVVSICKLVKVTKQYDSGERDVIIEAEKVAKLDRFESVFPKKFYPGGYITAWENHHAEVQPTQKLLKLFTKYVEMRFGAVPDHQNIAHYRLMDVAASIALSNEDKLKFYTQETPQKMEQNLMRSLRYLILLLEQESRIENGIILN